MCCALSCKRGGKEGKKAEMELKEINGIKGDRGQKLLKKKNYSFLFRKRNTKKPSKLFYFVRTSKPPENRQGRKKSSAIVSVFYSCQSQKIADDTTLPRRQPSRICFSWRITDKLPSSCCWNSLSSSLGTTGSRIHAALWAVTQTGLSSKLLFFTPGLQCFIPEMPQMFSSKVISNLLN